MDARNIYAGVLQVLAIAWFYSLYLNPDWLWIVGASAGAKYRLQGYALCSTGAHIRYGDLSATDRRDNNVVEDASDGVDFIGVDTSKCKDGIEKDRS